MLNRRRAGWLLVLGWLGVVLACNMPIGEPLPPLQQPGPPPAASAEPTAAVQMAPTATLRAAERPTAEPTATLAPLALAYQIAWRIDPQDSAFAVATVRLQAQGGNGVYTYYRDEIRMPGPEFEYRWGSCRANPGSFRVESGDGQTLKLDYYTEAPCP